MAQVNRRRFLALGVAGTALLGLGGTLSWLKLGYGLAPGDIAIGLSTKKLAIVRALVEVIAPAADGFPGGLALGVHQRVDEEIWATTPDDASDLRSAIQLLEHLPPFFGFAGRFSSLSAEKRTRCFEAYLRGGPTVVVQAAIGLKQMIHLFTYGSEPTWVSISYEGPWIRTPKPPASALHYADLLAKARGST